MLDTQLSAPLTTQLLHAVVCVTYSCIVHYTSFNGQWQTTPSNDGTLERASSATRGPSLMCSGFDEHSVLLLYSARVIQVNKQ